MSLKHRFLSVLALLAICLLTVTLVLLFRDSRGVQPIAELPDSVFFTKDGEWPEFYAVKAPPGTGWVHLPAPNSHSPFRSGTDPYVQGFIPPQVCGECHTDEYADFPQTAHFQTSSLATAATVLGDFRLGKNRLATKDPNVVFEMDSTDDGLFQRVRVQREGHWYEHRARFDLVTGSGNHGQTYLYWHGDRLCQLPISYFTESGGWINSPGSYRDGTADFGRGIGDRCLSCHTTYFASDPTGFSRHDRTNFLLGVTCVRCHGPGWAHVQYHRSHPDDKESRYIVNPADLSKERANEVCAQCHSGAGELIQPAFAYRPGEPLAEYLKLDMNTELPENSDPHAANQLLRLMKSRCFQQSERMTCSVCHDAHRRERGDVALFSQRCAACHLVESCKLAAEHGARIQDRCVDCHMPSQRDVEGAMETREGVLQPLLRDHYIRSWPEATARVLEQLRAKPQ